MTSGYAPPTIPSVDTGTPPMQWSESLLESRPTKDTPTTFSKTKNREANPEMAEETQREESQVTKETEKPGSKTGTEPKPTGDQTSIGATVVQTAKQYVPEPVGKAVDYAAQTASAAASYIPDPQGIKDAVSSYLSSGERQEEPHVSLPSTELRGALPAERIGGVGALPGNLSESSVALLPDERQERAQELRPPSPRQRRDTIKLPAEAVDDEPRKSGKGEATMIPDSGSPADEPVTSQSSGALPRSIETSARESVESKAVANYGSEVESQKETSQQQNPSQEVGAAGAAALGMVATAPSTEAVGEKQDDVRGSNPTSEKLNENKGSSQDVQGISSKEEETTTAKKSGVGYAGDYHPAQLHPPPPGASAAEYKSSLEPHREERESPTTTTTTGKRASVSSEKKPGLMTMMKGEMKILAGKMSGNEHKVEEGKKIVHGEA